MNICIFGASSEKLDREYYEKARETGRLIAEAGHTLIYGGGCGGVMGKCAGAAAESGGRIIGIAPKFFDEPDILCHEYGELILTGTMEERKMLMWEKSDAFAALPGGIGTYDELFGCITLRQLGVHSKPIALLNTRGFFEPFCELIDRGIKEGFISSGCRDLFAVCDTPQALADHLTAPRHNAEKARGLSDYT